MDFLPTSAPGILMVGCPTYMVQLMGESVQWDMCDNLMDVFMVGTGRIVLIAFVTLFFVIGMVGRLAT
jgi:heme/copper-type cytochrome/quinol oxidase subunit 2